MTDNRRRKRLAALIALLVRTSPMTTLSTVLITGASSGIGAIYAERFTRRGHNLVLVARDKLRLDALAARLSEENDVSVEVLQADLTNSDDLTALETRLRDDARIGVLINNAGIAQSGGFIEQSAEAIEKLVALNIVALTRLAAAVAPRFAQSGTGSIVNLGSVVGLAPELGMTVYGATKAYVLFLSQGLNLELAPKGVYIQAVLPAATRTEIWERAGIDLNTLPEVMDVEELVDAALVGFDRRELVTIPPLHVAGRWDALDGARQGLLSDIRQANAAERYLTKA
ncbi:Oxidoreductase, short chain dehydrogenase/reductase family [Pseudomonas savastanoi pv. nerii]|uniref:Oxidoreductase, short chain dehydrogenase/reductase family n=2 Tax=Pseudomonas savastanoi pv. nerii TaxID=360921 RepID=A0A0P9W8D9_PSESS|nr:Oxidoreductase, short chain dehydrogenase/reductase family [Pseudomonas savastanoi pv. nerii]KPY43824.1 Oxidoreductase, short chain dehydrogenase/reductase family [Pseudomonas savastanoi pv. retacarpa]KPY65234.1 Oxidoreductase, short chain dehydrogenase/reductase family [Pseudomonas savastanoi pv. savastanoi]KUG40499.1 Oxidoreductase, short chain dehydrogenase/reductase family [Pseudomonas savastanoi pv. fraxini]RMM03393.1 Oxidoreductase, short chain dehydrogenase/reductase family [Pseudomon